VTVSSFYLGKYEVTQKEWVAVMGANPSRFKGDAHPVERVSWMDVVEFCNRLSVMVGLQPCYTISGTSVSCDFSRNGYRLPTEAEWEYAARGGRQSRGYTHAGSSDANAVAWYLANSSFSTHPVGTKAANELGICDLSGNVWEWCCDWYGNYRSGILLDPTGPTSGSNRVLRGGAWQNLGYTAGVTYRSPYRAPGRRNDNFGFRVARRPG
jgi:sulfatase modifying factor 1